MEFKISQESLQKIINLVNEVPTRIGLPIIEIIRTEATPLDTKESTNKNKVDDANTKTKG